MKKAFVLGYGTLAYLLFLAAFPALIGFLTNRAGPVSIDRGPEASLATAVLIDCLLVLFFAVQHTIMARPIFKRRWTRIVPAPIERSTFVLVTSLVLLFTFWQWRPIPITLWRIENTAGAAMIWSLFAAGLVLTVLSTFLIDHFALFGIKQSILYAVEREHAEKPLKLVLFYRYIRHPLYLGFLIVLWTTPEMTAGHLLYAGLLTLYLLLGVQLEERELVRAHGRAYEEYQSAIPMLIPRLGRSHPS